MADTKALQIECQRLRAVQNQAATQIATGLAALVAMISAAGTLGEERQLLFANEVLNETNRESLDYAERIRSLGEKMRTELEMRALE